MYLIPNGSRVVVHDIEAVIVEANLSGENYQRVCYRCEWIHNGELKSFWVDSFVVRASNGTEFKCIGFHELKASK